MQTMKLKRKVDYPAPDGSEIRLLPSMKRGGTRHCTLPVGKTSMPVAHRMVEEIWFVVSGDGEVWRKNGKVEKTVKVGAGSSLTIPPKAAFQFRNTGDSPLCIIIGTMPRWPGPKEAKSVAGKWPVKIAAAKKVSRSAPS